MGILAGYTKLYILKFLIYTILTLLDIIKESIFTISNFLRLSNSVEPEPSSHFQESQTPTSTQPPLSAVIIRKLLPATKFSDIITGSGGGECAVCLYEFECDEEIRCLKNCQHFFHSDCIDGWMDHDRKTCPLCRKSLVPLDLQDEYNNRLWAASCSDYDLYGEDYEVAFF